MEYKGKLYQKMAGSYMDSFITGQLYTELVQSLKESNEQCSRMQLEILRLENENLILKSKIQKKCTCKNKSICYSCSNKYT